MHEHRVPMRWADLDSLDHVNNVVYLAYAAEGRAAMVEAGLLADSAVVIDMTVRFVRPLRLGRRPVVVVGTVSDDGDEIVQQITVDGASGRTVFAEVTTRTGERTAATPRDDLPPMPMSLRREDLGADGAATTTKIFELFQEARVLHVSSLLTGWRPGRFVVGTSAVTFRAPTRWQDEPLHARAWVSRVGRGSFEMRSELSDGRTVLADSTTVLVGFDASTQSSKAFDEAERAKLANLLKI